jgi:hypothetical protein
MQLNLIGSPSNSYKRFSCKVGEMFGMIYGSIVVCGCHVKHSSNKGWLVPLINERDHQHSDMLTWKIMVTRSALSSSWWPTTGLHQPCRIWEWAMLVELAKESSKPRPGPSEA